MDRLPVPAQIARCTSAPPSRTTSVTISATRSILFWTAGLAAVGIESTVLDLSTDVPMILRPGGVSKEQIESVIGPVQMKTMLAEASTPAKSPGQGVSTMRRARLRSGFIRGSGNARHHRSRGA